MSAPRHSELLGGRAEPLLLFGEGDGLAEPSRRRRRQIKLAQIGRHPISIYLRQAFSAGLRLHPQAPRKIDARPSPYRCGTCKFCEPLDANGQDFDPLDGTDYAHPTRLIWKCFRWPEKVTRGGATTIRLMWPACIHWKEPERAETPAEREVPDPGVDRRSDARAPARAGEHEGPPGGQ
jgi:hypothetical protein